MWYIKVSVLFSSGGLYGPLDHWTWKKIVKARTEIPRNKVSSTFPLSKLGINSNVPAHCSSYEPCTTKSHVVLILMWIFLPLFVVVFEDNKQVICNCQGLHSKRSMVSGSADLQKGVRSFSCRKLRLLQGYLISQLKFQHYPPLGLQSTTNRWLEQLLCVSRKQNRVSHDRIFVSRYFLYQNTTRTC